jgi:hypothetical protein
MNPTVAFTGALFFLVLATAAAVLNVKRVLRRERLRLEDIAVCMGGSLLSGILLTIEMGAGQWPKVTELDKFRYSVTVAGLLFFGGLAGWGFRYLKKGGTK